MCICNWDAEDHKQLYTIDESPLNLEELAQFDWLIANKFIIDKGQTNLEKRRGLLWNKFFKRKFNNFEPIRDLEFEKLQEYYKSQK